MEALMSVTDWDLEKWRSLIQIASSIATLIGVIVGLRIYRRNPRLERAKWVTTLYEKFFENEALKKIRDSLDVPPDSPKVNELVIQEKPEFTDYLNFFEYVAIRQESGQLRGQEVNDLFSYFLACLKRHQRVQASIKNDANGDEKLRKLLGW
jgi:hypothetical protein